MNKVLFSNVNADSIRRAFVKNRYPIFEDGRTILVNVRSSDRTVGIFNDVQCVCNFTRGILTNYSVTVDPGLNNLLSPVSKNGCAIVAPGYYPNVWAIGLHKGKYPALVQHAPIEVFRDNDKDAEYDYLPRAEWTNLSKTSGAFRTVVSKAGFKYLLETGNYGINCHRASEWKILPLVGLYSAGCVVHEIPNIFKGNFMDSIKGTGQKVFDAAWIDSEDLI